MSTHRNISFATIAGLTDVQRDGFRLTVRGEEVQEIRNRITILQRPKERCLFLPQRGNNVFAALAETFWVIAGRNDVDWLSHYLPRAKDFSDDGKHWRGGYGPRLRNWGGVDQLEQVKDLLLQEPLTRRAVMSLYDPGKDFVASKDIPCNNWLHWLCRDERLHLNVAVRSNDVIWGFSGVNAFEWSILQEMMAFWAGKQQGELTFIASSFHVYQRHYSLAEKLVQNFRGITCYDFGIAAPPFSTNWEDFREAMNVWLRLEAELRDNPNHDLHPEAHLSDQLLTVALRVLRVYHGARSGWSIHQIRDALISLPPCDLTAASYEYFGRKHPELLSNIPEVTLRRFFDAYGDQDAVKTAVPAAMFELIKKLHAQKDAAYGNAWKRRGEQTSILANVARKVDRLESYQLKQSEMPGESLLDTAVDLLVYLTKYRLFLLERVPSGESLLPPNAPKPFSDHVCNFNALVDELQASSSNTDNKDHATLIIAAFESLNEELLSNSSSAEIRLAQVVELIVMTAELVSSIARRFPYLVQELANSLGEKSLHEIT
jgi:thymidylate synthase